MTPSSDAPPGDRSATGRRCILLVEDELLIRMLVGDSLRDGGYDVIEACNADEALTILKSAVHVDLIISDVRMPGPLDGLGLLGFVRESFPALPVIMTSSHLDPAEALASGASRFLPKPFSIEWVIEAVAEEIAGLYGK